MALNSQYATIARNAAADALAALCNTGFLDIYDGAQAANANTAVGAQVKLARLALSATAFAAAVAGVATANAIANAAALATGTATWFRVLKADGTTVVFDGSVGTATSNLVMNSVAIQINATVSVSSLTLTEAAAGS